MATRTLPSEPDPCRPLLPETSSSLAVAVLSPRLGTVEGVGGWVGEEWAHERSLVADGGRGDWGGVSRDGPTIVVVPKRREGSIDRGFEKVEMTKE